MARAPFIPYQISAYDSVYSCNLNTTNEINSSSSHFRVQVILKGRNRGTGTVAMIDSGATALFLDHSFIKKHNILLTPLRQPIDLYNIDGSFNQAGQITHFARLKLTLDGYDEWTDFLATNLGGENVILGLPWL